MQEQENPSIKVAHLCFADARGGGAIGARRLHQAMQANGVDSTLFVVEKYGEDESVIRLPNGHRRRKYAADLGQRLTKLQRSDNPIIRTLNIMPVGTARVLNEFDADIVQMHWIGANTISIGEIVNINKPVVWKLPDMWAFSGAEHYLLPGDKPRYETGYDRFNRQSHESGFDLDRMIWRYKRWRWGNANFSVVTPSRWLGQCAKDSLLFRKLRIRHILNPLDTALYRPRDPFECRSHFGLPNDKKLIAFGAMHATRDTRKGFAHLKAALGHFRELMSPEEVEFVVIGADSSDDGTNELNGFKVNYLGTISDEEKLVKAYNVADVFVFPTEADNLPNVVKEATCCGVPCVGFSVGGMPDMIEHLDTGYLAKPFDARELAQGILWTVNNISPSKRKRVRELAEAKHAQKTAVTNYLEFYREILKDE